MIKRKTKLTRKVGVNKKTSTQRVKEKSMHRMYDVKLINDTFICTGCGTPVNLTHSHIISRSDKDLMDDSRNVTYHCANIDGNNGCSWKWEQVGLRTTLLDYERNMDFIAEVRPDLFRKMISADYNYLIKNPDQACKTDFFNYICKQYKIL